MNNVKKLMDWYGANKRDLPWRRSKDPYKVWLSEIILQQTRVDQGMDYYLKFTDKYPDVNALAAASEQEVLKMWQGLGYYSRARNMLATAKNIVEHHRGRFPRAYEEIIGQKGIGPYTASAIASIAFDEPLPVIDGNVKRVISRLYGIYEPVNASKGIERISDILHKLIDRKNPGDFNQAVMELGALVCRPRNPLCDICPLAQTCKAKLEDAVDNLPVIERKTRQTARNLNYLVLLTLQDKEVAFWIRKRTGNDIWRNMYDFPLIEDNDFDLGQARLIKTTSTYKHQLSHQLISAIFHIYIVTSRLTLPASRDLLPITIGDLHQYPIPRLIERFIQDDLVAEIKKFQE